MIDESSLGAIPDVVDALSRSNPPFHLKPELPISFRLSSESATPANGEDLMTQTVHICKVLMQQLIDSGEDSS